MEHSSGGSAIEASDADDHLADEVMGRALPVTSTAGFGLAGMLSGGRDLISCPDSGPRFCRHRAPFLDVEMHFAAGRSVLCGFANPPPVSQSRDASLSPLMLPPPAHDAARRRGEVRLLPLFGAGLHGERPLSLRGRRRLPVFTLSRLVRSRRECESPAAIVAPAAFAKFCLIQPG